MIGKLILTHGGLARELLSAAQVISGRLNGFEALSLDWNDTFEEARAKVRAAIERLDEGQGVLILTDMYGGTPSNVAVTFLESGRVEVLTGVNLPMVLRLACQAEEPQNLGDMARWLQSKGQRSLCLVSEMQPKKCGPLEPAPVVAVASEVKK
ncbi:MAG TPA: PTS sugar transporter subunit IIA [Thermoanaerobaculia bacterium]|nr:PTS sugar transporter subunit IIA [Thermoanaerobaculia bacterium]